MARARSPRAPDPAQLSLEGWAEMLSASHDSSETPCRGATSVNAPASVDAVPDIDHQPECASAKAPSETARHHHPMATELLATPGALLTRTHLRELGLERRAVDAVFRALPVVALPGYSRPMIRADKYVELVERSTFDDDRIRPSAPIMSRRPHGA